MTDNPILIYDWPSILVANAEMFRIDARTRSGGETIAGREQVVGSGLGRWVARLTVPLHTPAKIRAMRSLMARLEGRANGVRVGPCDCRNGNRLAPAIHDIPYRDKARHDDGAGFMQGGAPPGMAEAAPAGAIFLKIANGSTVLPVLEGSFIGIAGYLYVVVGVAPLPEETTRLEIRPKLRVEAPDGAPVEWCRARVPMRLAVDDSGEFELQLARMGTATLDLVEMW
ncbi:hypothetical protein [Inquilinus limosus]|uniref:Uncharacterized protein n=1 Tax=Inquilinus limosus TaxID=171674 RepID=A0A211ZTT3_9PROT|nr:hypothetical protein [Inquilinus limosus]OWJ68702.1 hypothetical protein BWR60_02840 [Inquilinus limosus]